MRWLVTAVVTVSIVLPAEAALAIPRGRLAIGDSVMLGAREELRARGLHVDAVVSRQFDDVPRLVRRLERRGELRRKVVVHLGTNGVLIDPSDCDALARIAGHHRRVFLVTIQIPRRYRAIQNRRLRGCARRHMNTSLIDWFGYSDGHRSWFGSDGYHLTPRGQRRYAGLLDRRTSERR